VGEDRWQIINRACLIREAYPQRYNDYLTSEQKAPGNRATLARINDIRDCAKAVHTYLEKAEAAWGDKVFEVDVWFSILGHPIIYKGIVARTSAFSKTSNRCLAARTSSLSRVARGWADRRQSIAI
jgi:hypothetical protein